MNDWLIAGIAAVFGAAAGMLVMGLAAANSYDKGREDERRLHRH